MRTSRAVGLTALLASTLLGSTALLAGGASADPATVVSGNFKGPITYSHCTQGTPPSPGIAGGTWSVTLHGSSAKGAFDILIDKEPHLSYTFPGMKQAPGSTASHFVVYGRTLAGLLTVSVNDSSMAYTIAPYSYDGLTCESVTFPGTVG